MEPRGRGKARAGRGRGDQQPPQKVPRPGGSEHLRSAQPQGAWGRPQGPPQPQGAWARPSTSSSEQPQRSAWGQQQQGGPSSSSQQSQRDQPYGGRGSRIGGGDDGSNREVRGTTTGGADMAVESAKSKERGGGNGVRGRTNRTEIIHTRPPGLPTKQGKSGRPIRLTANFFMLVNRPDWCLHEYRVDFVPDLDDTRLKKKLFYIAFRKTQESSIGGFLFDGTKLYTPHILKPDPMTRVAQLDDGEKYTMSARHVGELKWGDWQYISVFNLIVRKCLHLMKLELIGREYFDSKAKIDVPEHRMCLWPGYFTSIRQYEKEIMLNCEVKFKHMRSDNVYDLLIESVDRSGRQDLDLFRQKIIGSVVLTSYNNKTYKIDDVDFNQTPQSTFQLRNNERVSYIDYYKQKYGIHIQVPTQPLLLSLATKRELRAGMPEMLYLIPELCQMTGMTDDQRMNFHLMSDLAKHTRLPPGPRQNKLLQFARRMAANEDAMKEVRQWNMSLANNLVEFQGRVLPEETITVGNDVSFRSGMKADWTRNLVNNALVHLANMQQLAVITPRNLEDRTYEFMKLMCSAAQSLRFNINNFKIFPIRDDRIGSYLDKIEEVINMNPTLILTVIPHKTADRYNPIKKKCYVDRGIPNQVVVARNFNSKGKMSIATKIAIQMNCKIGGAPWMVNIPTKETMIVGYDVCRDTAKNAKSFGGMVGSLDQHCTRYFSSSYEHTNEEELSNNFATFMLLACHKFKEVRGGFPARIIIYRDGVGDGQIPFVVEHEVKNIRNKLDTEIYTGENKVRMAFIIVNKRINTRIFNRDENPPPGTVVDNTITLPERYDFYIVSQCVNQGTVSPTSYNIISDNSGLDPDKLQILTYKLCHLYYNWSGTVKVPAPCQYAHKLSQLVAQNLHRPAHRRLENLLYYL